MDVGEETGYFDDIVDILRAREHPIIMLEEAAMRWMGLPVGSNNLDLLIKDCQFDQILADILGTGQYERIQQDLRYRLSGPLSRQVPRLQHIDEEHPFHRISISLWSESEYILSTDAPMVEVPDLFAWNFNLMEDRFDLAAADSPSVSYKAKIAAGWQLVPRTLSQSPGSEYPIYIPSIPCLIDAFLDQYRYRQAHVENYYYKSTSTCLPSIHLTRFIRHLHLARPYQWEKLIPQLSEHNRADMEARLDKYKMKEDAASSSFGQ
jgi:hypothetical protein